MGQLIVRRLLDAGHRVTGWNRSRDKADELIAAGMRWADSPRALAQTSEIVFSIVTDAAAVRAIALGRDGVVAGPERGDNFIDTRTTSPHPGRQEAGEMTT